MFLFAVKCIKNTPGYFAERLYKSMKVQQTLIIKSLKIKYEFHLSIRITETNILLYFPNLLSYVSMYILSKYLSKYV